jgi:hypothetical protein
MGKTALTMILVMLLAAIVAAQEEKPSGEQPERELRQGEVHGTIIFSDGSSITGIIHQSGWKPLKVFDTKKKKFKHVPFEHIAVLEVVVTKSEMVKDWRFKEESKTDKVYSGKEYPRKDYEVRITLRGGQEVAGTCVGVFYIESGDEKTRFNLKHYDRGKTDEVLDDLVHLKEIRIADPNEKPVDCRIFGTVKPEGELVDVIAVQHRHKMFVRGKVDAESGSYAIKDLLPGYYDVVLVTKDSAFIGLGMEGEDFSEDSLSDQDKADLAKRVWEIKDFFEEKRVLHVVGNVKRAKAIVKTVRKGKTSLEKKGDLPLVFFHLEYWVMHKVGERWLVDWRIQLVREKGEQETKKDTKTFVLRPELADRKIETGGTQLKIDFNALEAEGGDEDDVIGR